MAAIISGHDQIVDGYQGDTKLLVPTLPAVGTTAVIAISGSSARAALPVGARVYQIALDATAHVTVGDSEVAATTGDAAFSPGTYHFMCEPVHTHVAVIGAA